MGTPTTTTLPAPAQGKLLNVLGLAFGLSITVGGSVGVGILVQPGVVATHLPDSGLFLAAWLAGGLYVLLGAFAVAELAAMTPRSGAFYVYVRRALGEYAGFVTGWAHWLALCSGAAFIAVSAAKYIAYLVPVVAGNERAVAASLVVGFAVLQWRSVRRAGRIQELTTVLKAAAFLGLVVCFFALGDAQPDSASPAPAPVGWALLAGFLLAFPAILQTYDGWEGAIYFGEEVRNPGRTLPRSLIAGTLIVIALYLCVNLALLAVLPVGRIAGQPMAIAAGAGAVFGPAGGTITFALATATVLAVFNAGTMQTPRVLYAMSRDGLFFTHASRVNEGGTPTVALFLSTALILVFLAVGTTKEFVAVMAFFLIANYSLVFIALFVLRWREPEADRPYRAWGYPWTAVLGLAGSLTYLGASMYADETRSSPYVLVLLAASYPTYLLVRWLRRVSARRQDAPAEAPCQR